MKTLLIALLTVAGFSASASSYGPHNLGWTDFVSKERFTLTVGGYETPEAAKAAAVATIADVLNGNLSAVANKMNQDLNVCKDLAFNSTLSQALGEYIAERGEYLYMSAGFTVETGYSADGTPSSWANIKGFIPCVKN